MKTKTKALLALLPLVAFPSIAFSAGWDSFWSAIGETLPASVSDSDEGYFSKTWDGLKTIMRDGNTGLLVPAYTMRGTIQTGVRKTATHGAAASPATTLMLAATAEFFMRWRFPIPTILLNLSWATRGWLDGSSAQVLCIWRRDTPSV